MTKKDYIKIADILRKFHSNAVVNNNAEMIYVIEGIANDFADMLKEDNANFDRNRFNAYLLR